MTLAPFTACAHTAVVPMGQGNYMVARQAAMGFLGLGNLKTEVLTEANQHCVKQSKSMQVLNSTETAPPYILWNYPRAEVQFACVERKGKP